MSTRGTGRKGGHTLPAVQPDDPGPWAIVSTVARAQAARMSGLRRGQVAPPGLLLAHRPRVGIPLAGLDPGAAAAGGGPIRIVAGLADPVRALEVRDDGRTLVGIAPQVVRLWTLPGLQDPRVDRREPDPAAALPPLPGVDALEGDLAGHTVSPDGALVAVGVQMGSMPALALVRADGTRGLVRFIVGARTAAWTPDGEVLFIGGDFGLLAAHRRSPEHPPG